MTDGVHIRLMVSRGVKATPYQDPRMTITPPTVVIIPEYKEALPGTFAGLVPVTEVDGRVIGEGDEWPVIRRLRTCIITP